MSDSEKTPQNPKPLKDQATELYDSLAEKVKENLQAFGDTAGEKLEDAIDKAVEHFKEASDEVTEEIAEIADAVRDDLSAIKWEEIGEKTKLALDPTRVGSGFLNLMSSIFHAGGNSLQKWAKKTDAALAFSTGKITGPGTLTCNKCGTKMHFEESHRIPPCPKCHATKFHKSY